MCVPYLTLQARSRQTNFTFWINTSIYLSMHSFRLQNCSCMVVTTIYGQNHSQVCSNWLTPTLHCSERFSHSLDTLCPSVHWSVLIATVVRQVFLHLGIEARHLLLPLSSIVSASYLPTIIQNSAWCMLNTVCVHSVPNVKKTTCYTTGLLLILWSRHKLDSFDYLFAIWLFSMLSLSSKGKFHADSSATCL